MTLPYPPEKQVPKVSEVDIRAGSIPCRQAALPSREPCRMADQPARQDYRRSNQCPDQQTDRAIWYCLSPTADPEYPSGEGRLSAETVGVSVWG